MANTPPPVRHSAMSPSSASSPSTSQSAPITARHRRQKRCQPMENTQFADLPEQHSNSQQQIGAAENCCQMATNSSSSPSPSSSSFSSSSFPLPSSSLPMANRPRLLFSLLLLLLCLSANIPLALALPRPSSAGQVPVGGIFTLSKDQGAALDVKKMPSWMGTAANGQLVGIPQLKDAGKEQQIQLNDGRNVPIEVVPDQQGICGPERTIIWLEIVDPKRKMSQMTADEQFKEAQSLLGTLKEVGVRQQDLRLFPYAYLAQYRKVAEVIHGMDDGEETAKADDQLVFLLNISCGELTEQASDIINAVAENGLPFQVVQGTLHKSKEEKGDEEREGDGVTTQKPVGQLKRGQESEEENSSSAVLVSLILLIILMALVAGLALYWLKNKQARKRQKQAATNEANGKGSARPNDVPPKNAAALSPDASMGTVTTPMLPEEEEANKKS